MEIKEFMQKNNIVILVEANIKAEMFHIHKANMELKSYDLFQQLILYANMEDLIQNVTGQLMPRIWSQGTTKCVIFKPSDEKIICVFYDTLLDVKENYFYAKDLSDKINELF